MFRTGFQVWSRLFLVSLSVLLLPLAVQAELPGEVVKDFRPLSGMIVMQAEEEFLIDLDAGDGIVEGDLFSVVLPGERVVHPVTGEVLGTLAPTKGILQVTRVKQGYSITRPVGDWKGIAKGDTVRRYENIRAVFWDYSGNGEPLFAGLQNALPGLEWQGYDAAQANRPPEPVPLSEGEPLLVFLHRPGSLEVRGPGFRVLQSYSIGAAPAASTSAPGVQPIVTPPAPLPTTGGVVVPSGDPGSEAGKGGIVHADKSRWEGVWSARDLTGSPVGLEVGDFDGDGLQESAILYADRLEILRVMNGKAELLTTLPQEKADKFLTIDSADLNDNGIRELYITAVNNQKPASMVVEFDQGSYRVTADLIPYYLRRVAVTGEAEVLLGQRMGDLNSDFDPPIFRALKGEMGITPGAKIHTPWGIEIFGFSAFQAGNGEPLFANLSQSGRLQVLRADGEKLWESSQPYGGSKLSFERRDTAAGPGIGTRNVVLKPRIQALEGGGVLVPHNEGGGMFDAFTDLGPSRVTALQWTGEGMRELWHTRPQEGFLADFRFDDIDNDGVKELAMVVVSSSPGLLSKGRGSLIVYELK